MELGERGEGHGHNRRDNNNMANNLILGISDENNGDSAALKAEIYHKIFDHPTIK